MPASKRKSPHHGTLRRSMLAVAGAAVIFTAGCSSSGQDATASGTDQATDRTFLENCKKTVGGGTVDTTFGGRAYALAADASVLGAPLALPGLQLDIDPISDTGALPSEGGELSETLVELESTENPLISLSAALLDASVNGTGDMTVAFAQTTEVNLAVMDGTGGNLLSVDAGVLQAHSALACDNAGNAVPTDAHGANIFGLNISLLGTEIPIPANAPPNTNLLEELPAELAPLVSGKIVLNEQFVDDDGRHHVNALHIDLTVLGATDAAPPLATVKLIVSHAEASLTCGVDDNGGVACPCQVNDFVTGGGSINSDSGKHTYFSFNGGHREDNELRGDFNIDDHREGEPPLKVRSNTLLEYVIVDQPSNRRLLTYDCTVDGTPDTCHVEIDDNGNPESGDAGVDDLVVMSEGGFQLRGEPIDQGNIFMHRPPNCPTPE